MCDAAGDTRGANVMLKWLLTIKQLFDIVPEYQPGDGMKDYALGVKLEDNPYPKSSADHSLWRDDWLFSAGRFR